MGFLSFAGERGKVYKVDLLSPYRVANVQKFSNCSENNDNNNYDKYNLIVLGGIS